MPLIEAQTLLANPTRYRIVDTRFTLGKPDAGREAFETGHIPGAIFADLERDLSAPVHPDRIGGRHPLPSPEALAARLGQLGISNQDHVVAYDDPSTGSGFYAAHLWWILRYLGHERVSVLNGGLPAWVAAGGSIEPGAQPDITPTAYQANPNSQMIVDADYVANRDRAKSVLIDSRAPERYRGEVEPLDWKAGHIPGAINRNWADGVREQRWKSAEEQRERFPDAQEIIVYCGSGVSAAGNLLALEIAGIPNEKIRLYAGSWSDWISGADPRPIATGTEE